MFQCNKISKMNTATGFEVDLQKTQNIEKETFWKCPKNCAKNHCGQKRIKIFLGGKMKWECGTFFMGQCGTISMFFSPWSGNLVFLQRTMFVVMKNSFSKEFSFSQKSFCPSLFHFCQKHPPQMQTQARGTCHTKTICYALMNKPSAKTTATKNSNVFFHHQLTDVPLTHRPQATVQHNVPLKRTPIMATNATALHATHCSFIFQWLVDQLQVVHLQFHDHMCNTLMRHL